MNLFLITLGYLILATGSNTATLYLSYSGHSYLLALSGIIVKLLEFYIIFTLAKRHANPKFIKLFQGYWLILIATALGNFFIQGQVNYIMNVASLACWLGLIVLLLLAPVSSKRLKTYSAFKIIWILYTASLFVKALTNSTADANTIILILILSFICDFLLVFVAWWSQKQFSKSS